MENSQSLGQRQSPRDPTLEVTQLRREVQEQAETLKALLGWESDIIDMLGDIAELLDNG